MSVAEVKIRPTNPVPAHVPPDLVEVFDFHADPGYRRDPQARMDALRDGRRAFYTPIPRSMVGTGTWVFTHADDIRAIMQDPETFRSGGARAMGELVGDTWHLIPTDLDPPEHGKFRTLLNPLFSPKKIAALEDKVRARAVELIEPLSSRTSCEFIKAFARPFPVSIFLELLGLPLARMDHLIELEEAVLHASPASQVEGIRALRDYLRTEIEARRRNPTDDLITFAIQGQVDGRATTDDEVMGICFMLFIGGLDTVTSTLGYVFRHLAENPTDQAALRDDPSLIPNAVEELIRTHAVVTTGRIVTRDVTIGGVALKAGDYVSMPMTAASRDPAEFEDPATVILDRSPNRHSAFGYGPHRCIGSHLARREAIIALEEWLRLLPPFRVAPGANLWSSGTGVISLHDLPLVWD